ncbi:MAG: phenylacetate--CoA ligase [Clostridia bacterium]|nr:phenylacetate--CoA ligase [Clostridia bacterium]
MIWNETTECMSRDQMHHIQTQRLKETVSRVYQNVEFYRKKMQAMGIEPGDIKDADDIVKLPFTVKKDLRDNYPYGLLSAHRSEIVRLHASSGTTGKPIVIGLTRKDVNIFAEIVARAICSAGGTRDDIVQVAYGYGLFTGGLGLHYGAENLGATVVPISGGNTAKQMTLMQDFGATILACTPSYAAHIAESLHAAGVDTEKLPLRIGIFGAEPWSEEMRHRIEEGLHIEAHDIYGLSEVMGPGVACSCSMHDGLHIAEDHFMPEVIDPDTLEPVKDGTMGELVFTTITKEGMPLLRYRTRDLSSLTHEKCECGRTNVRMSKIMARSDDMLIIRGVNVFPSQVESVLMNIPEATTNYMLIVDRKGTMDTLEIQLELNEEYMSDEISEINRVRNNIKQKVESVLGISVIINPVERKTIERSEGKARRVIDRRKI